MPKSKSSVKGSRNVNKKSSKNSVKRNSKKTSKKNSKETRRSYKNVTSSTEDMRQLLSSEENRTYNNGYQQPMMYQQQQMPQHQIMSPSQVDPMLINHTVPYQDNKNFMGMNPQSLMSSQQMVQGLQNFSNMNINEPFNNNILSPVNNQLNIGSTPNFTAGVVNSPMLGNNEMSALQGPMMKGNISQVPINDSMAMPMQNMPMQNMPMQNMPMQGMPMQNMSLPNQLGGNLNIMNIKNFL